jgi:tRNA(adenine34) deaminase
MQNLISSRPMKIFTSIPWIFRRFPSSITSSGFPRARIPPSCIKATLQEALAGSRENNGGVGACLVRERTGQIVERGHNRQFAPYFRSDLHAEMDLLTRYEGRVKARGADNPSASREVQRQIQGLILYTSVETCPMCLTRI